MEQKKTEACTKVQSIRFMKAEQQKIGAITRTKNVIDLFIRDACDFSIFIVFLVYIRAIRLYPEIGFVHKRKGDRN